MSYQPRANLAAGDPVQLYLGDGDRRRWPCPAERDHGADVVAVGKEVVHLDTQGGGASQHAADELLHPVRASVLAAVRPVV